MILKIDFVIVFIAISQGMMCFIVSGDNAPNLCAHDTACNCTEVALKCKCRSSELIILQSFAKYHWKTVLVEDCNFVQIKLAAFLHMNLEEVVFRNINKLKFLPFALSGIVSMGKLRIENINDLDVDLFGISGLNGLESFKITNVTAPNLGEFAISGNNISVFEIESSSVILDAFSIVLWSMNDIYIRNTNFQCQSNTSLIIRTADRVHFQKSVFTNLTQKSIAILWTDVVEILNCSFANLPPTFLFGHTDNFYFNDNIIENSERNAFDKFFVIKTAEFKNNKFRALEADSIFPNPNNNVTELIQKISVSENQFHCDCRLEWLFTGGEIYLPMIHSSYCYNYKDIALSQTMRFFFSNETCNFSGYESNRKLDQINRQLLKDKRPTMTSDASLLYIGTIGHKILISIFILLVLKMIRIN